MRIKKIFLLIIMMIAVMMIGCSFSQEVKYKVSFYADGKLISSASYSKGEEINLPDNPTSDKGYFIGWDVNGDGNADEITICNNNMNIRAIFGETIKYTIIFKDGNNELSKKSYSEGEMPVEPTSPTKDGYVFVGWDMNGDDEVDEITSATKDVTYVAVFRDDNQTYVVEFYVGANKISSNEYHLGDPISQPTVNPTKDRTAQYSYSFLGWDVNSDGNVESFPYVVKGNHRFVAIFTETLNKYTYRLYDGLELLQEDTVDYGTTIVFNGESFKQTLGVYYYLLGWDKNNDNIPDDLVVTGDVTYRAVLTNKQIVVMNYEDVNYLLYVEKGGQINLYSPNLPSSRKSVWYLDSSYETLYNPGPMPEGNLYLYGRSEPSYEMDCSVLDGSLKTVVHSEDELVDLFNYLVFTRTYNHSVRLDYELESEEIANMLCSRCTVDCSYQLSTSMNPVTKDLGITLQYKIINNDSTKSLYTEHGISYYDQYSSLNLRNNETPRSDGFQLFIDTVDKTFEVVDSEQLYYVLEHGYRPVIKAGNTNLQNLYAKMRNTLKVIINDSMSDYDKVLAINEWLVMNVTYDRVALQLSSNPSVTLFHSFYLEGVFDENLAVCDGISKALACLCNMEGIPAIRVTGTGAQNHAWNKVCIDGKWYVVDATSGGSIINDSYEVLTHRFFLITDEDFGTIYTEDGKYYPDFKAEGEYDYYDNYKYSYDGHEYKLRCTSKSDLVRVLRWFKDNATTNYTCDVELDFSYGDFSSLMSSALAEARYESSVVYSLNGKILLLIK